MLFNATTLAGLVEGRVDRTYRRWTVVRPRVGSRFTTSAGVVEVMSIELVDGAALTEQDAQRAGFDSLAALSRWTGRSTGDLYEIGSRLAGPDPRVALRNHDGLTADELTDLDARLKALA